VRGSTSPAPVLAQRIQLRLEAADCFPFRTAASRQLGSACPLPSSPMALQLAAALAPSLAALSASAQAVEADALLGAVMAATQRSREVSDHVAGGAVERLASTWSFAVRRRSAGRGETANAEQRSVRYNWGCPSTGNAINMQGVTRRADARSLCLPRQRAFTAAARRILSKIDDGHTTPLLRILIIPHLLRAVRSIPLMLQEANELLGHLVADGVLNRAATVSSAASCATDPARPLQALLRFGTLFSKPRPVRLRALGITHPRIYTRREPHSWPPLTLARGYSRPLRLWRLQAGLRKPPLRGRPRPLRHRRRQYEVRWRPDAAAATGKLYQGKLAAPRGRCRWP
jgi:hypothetical protein